MELAKITLSSLQLVPVTRIEEIRDEQGELGVEREYFRRISHGKPKIYGYGVTGV